MKIKLDLDAGRKSRGRFWVERGTRGILEHKWT